MPLTVIDGHRKVRAEEGHERGGPMLEAGGGHPWVFYEYLGLSHS